MVHLCKHPPETISPGFRDAAFLLFAYNSSREVHLKTKPMKTLRLLLLNSTLVFACTQAAAQTHGAGAINTSNSVGTAGTAHVFLGNFAGNANIAGGINNTFLGHEAGRYNYDQTDNVFVGFRAGYNNGTSDNKQKSSQNVFIGSEAGWTNQHGGNNTFVGYRAGYTNNYASGNSYFGVYAGYSGTGYSNSIFGFEAGMYNTADNNSFFGTRSGWANTTGTGNTALGFQSLYTNATGNNNTSVGFQAGLGTAGNSGGNCFYGYQSGFSISTGGANVFTGNSSGYYVTTADYNVFSGAQAGFSTTTGDNNVFMGYGAGATNSTGTNNTIIGYDADMSSAALTNAAAIGANTIVRNSNQMILGDNNTRVGINLSNDASGPLSVLSVGAPGNALYEVYAYQSGIGDGSVAIKGEGVAPGAVGSSNKVHGVMGVIGANYGYSFGVYGSAYKSTAHSNGRTYGVYGVAGNCTNENNFGVYGSVIGSNTGFAVYADGRLRTTNDTPDKLTSGTWAGYSDERLKKDIKPFGDGLDVIREVELVTYRFNGVGGIKDTSTFIGVIAQDVQKVAPYCVRSTSIVVDGEDVAPFQENIIETITSDSGTQYVVKVMQYDMTGLIYAMLNAIKELDSTVTELQAQAPPTVTPTMSGAADIQVPVQQVTLASGRAMLYQNAQNPAGNTTTINYYVAENAVNAEMIFYDSFGKELKRVALTNKGNASLDVNTTDLAAGIYSYSLVVDGAVIDTLKMMKAQ
jgi:hypothetical protein